MIGLLTNSLIASCHKKDKAAIRINESVMKTLCIVELQWTLIPLQLK